MKKAARVAGGCRDLGFKSILDHARPSRRQHRRIAKKPKVLGNGETDHDGCISQVAQLVKANEEANEEAQADESADMAHIQSRSLSTPPIATRPSR
jgi:hypothetical protein